MSAQVAADLRAAADVLERDGWTQGNYFQGRLCCQAGAILRALDPRATSSSALSSDNLTRWVDAEYRLQAFLGGDGPIAWNDSSDRTAAEVIATLRAAADWEAES